MAEKSFELFQVPQTQKITTFQTNIIPTLPSTTPLPVIIPNDAVSSNSDSNSDSNPPLYQLFSENRQQREYGAVSLPDDKLIQSSVPLGPFTGYASILKRSTFLKPAQQLLEDFCGSGFRVSEDPATAALSLSSGDKYRVGFPFKDSRLVFLLEEVITFCLLA
ncbi:hypothetical protein TIFTF001_010637 [Ficus carica]|uniref:Uncharacterized protein n=1 Tax=Ficus carica TaxID=3494 RepID=A0AA88D271_FICCA|nr:hypothetical protein TIFTF001_010637 [Ficus carica]